METIPLGKTGRSTTRLGFGCSSIMGGLGYRESTNILEAAWEAGIRHFDVAPMYGFGDAEACLGDFMLRHKGHITVTTKFGIPPARGGAVARILRAVARPVARRFPALKERFRPAPSQAPSAAIFAPQKEEVTLRKLPNPVFRMETARTSLNHSLAALKTDHIDVWLLHEFTANDVQDERLLRFLEESVQLGKVGTFGVGSDRSQIDSLVQLHPEYCPVLQYEWSVFDSLPPVTSSFRIHHRSLTNNFRSLHAALLTDDGRCSSWSELVGADLSDPTILAKLMLKAAVLLNPESVVLFSSKTSRHIQANAALMSDDSLTAPALALYRVVQTAAS